MINLYANKELKNLGCKWDGKEWVAPQLAKEEAKEIKKKYYEDLVIVKIDIKDRDETRGQRWGYTHAATIGGYIIATSSGRDNPAIVQKGIAFLKGGAESCGSRKNFYCEVKEGTVIKMQVSKNSLHLLDEESGAYDYEILEEDIQLNIDELIIEKNKLLIQLENIDKKIALLA